MTGSDLKVVWGPNEGEIFGLHVYSSIGRSTECSIVLDDVSLSRRHAEIQWTDEGYILTDCFGGDANTGAAMVTSVR